jgi:hypothetical protein
MAEIKVMLNGIIKESVSVFPFNNYHCVVPNIPKLESGVEFGCLNCNGVLDYYRIAFKGTFLLYSLHVVITPTGINKQRQNG